ncbi:TetR/AcrR family transcriptional regulator [Rhizohabitans arisaemae]|uniref:TetR/AcrR family transcriptional regulator n=1 Tax=Rhizohabitans arisaemae TaxID=2720610 RepID=UPI0024B17E60|nr:TetR/AcrR family transcriptional regulator [Rhizohabitans arisaemae]
MSVDSPAGAETRTRARTRRAILDAAVVVLGQDPAASLGDVAAAAGVGRTTIHRYFPERTDLISALGHDVLEKIENATARARPGEGAAQDALKRLCQEYFELGSGLMLLFNEPNLGMGEVWEEESDSDRTVVELIRRGQAEGTIDPALNAEWLQMTLWALLYAAWQHCNAWQRPPEGGVPKHEALSLCLRTLEKLIAL